MILDREWLPMIVLMTIAIGIYMFGLLQGCSDTSG